MSKCLYVTWQDPASRRWFPVGRLCFNRNAYEFRYTRGAKKASVLGGFVPFGRMESLESVYTSKSLFPLFANRLMDKSRPEYSSFMRWLNLQEKQMDPLTVLSLTEGLRGTDNLELFPCPEPTIFNQYEVSFFSRSLGHLPEHAVNCVNRLNPGDRLFVMHDLQNKYHDLALAIRTGDPVAIIGYCPRYLCNDFHSLLRATNPLSCEVVVVRVNLDAPLQLRLLCNFKAPWPKGFVSCSEDEYKILCN